MNELEANPQPQGQPTLMIPAMPSDTNAHGNIHAGWVANHMDTAAAIAAEQVAKCRVVTVSIDSMDFVSPIKVGSTVSFYATVAEVGRSSLKINVEAWAQHMSSPEQIKITDCNFVMVAVQDNGRVQIINK